MTHATSRHRPTRGDAARGSVCAMAAACVVVTAVLAGTPAPARAQGQGGFPSSFLRYAGEKPKPTDSASSTVPQLKNVSFRQQLGTTLPADAVFKDEHGRPVTLGRFFDGSKPTILAFVYYRCPMLCTQVMNGISSALKVVPFEAGKDFDVVLVSFDPRDTPAAALEKKRTHLAYWSVEQTAPAWHFLTGDEATIRRVADAAGFRYEWDERTQQFAHVSGVLVTTPDGRLSRYFYGVEYSPKELRLALVDSGEGRVGSAIDELLLYCFHYDPEAGRYGAVVMNLIRLGGVVTLMVMAGFFWLMRRRDTASHAEGHA